MRRGGAVLVALAALVLAGCAVRPLTAPIEARLPEAAAVAAEQVAAGERLYAVRAAGRFGFADAAGAVVIAPRYEAVGPFREGLARARSGGQWGYLRPDGTWAIEPVFVDAADFAGGRARVVLPEAPADLASTQARASDRRFQTFVTSDGTVLLDPDLAEARDFAPTSAGPLAVVARTRARRYVPFGLDAFDFLAPTFQGRPVWMGLDATGAVVFSAPFAERMLGFSDDRAAFQQRAGLFQRRGRWGYLAPDGTVAVAPRFEAAQPFSEGLAAVAERGRFGFVDAAGAAVIAPRFEAVGPFREGLARAREDGRWGYLRPDGSWAIPPRFEVAQDFSGGLAVIGADGRFGYVDATGAVVVEPRFGFARPFERGLALVRLGEREGYIDRTGAFVGPEAP